MDRDSLRAREDTKLFTFLNKNWTAPFEEWRFWQNFYFALEHEFYEANKEAH